MNKNRKICPNCLGIGEVFNPTIRNTTQCVTCLGKKTVNISQYNDFVENLTLIQTEDASLSY